jgi:hypothetical protein
MKGVIFVEFIEMVEDVFSAEMVDNIIDEAQLQSGGSYTAVGTYPHQELLDLVSALSNRVNVPVPELVYTFGKHLLDRFFIRYPEFFNGIEGTYSFVQTIERHIHQEVRKLYPEAELPVINCEVFSDSLMKVHYKSVRPFASLASGLLNACVEHYGENIEIIRRDLEGEPETHAEFTLTRV